MFNFIFLETNEYLKIPVRATIFSALGMFPMIIFSELLHRLIDEDDLAISAYFHLTTASLMCAFRAPMAYFVTFKTMKTDALKLQKQRLRNERLNKEMKNAFRTRSRGDECRINIFTVDGGLHARSNA